MAREVGPDLRPILGSLKPISSDPFQNWNAEEVTEEINLAHFFPEERRPRDLIKSAKTMVQDSTA